MENCHKEKSKNWENDKVLLIIWQIIIFVAEEKRRRKETELDIFPEKNKLRKIRENRLFQQFLWVGGAGVDLCPSPPPTAQACLFTFEVQLKIEVYIDWV